MKLPCLSPAQIEAAARKIADHVDDDGPGLSEEKERRLYETIRKILALKGGRMKEFITDLNTAAANFDPADPRTAKPAIAAVDGADLHRVR